MFFSFCRMVPAASMVPDENRPEPPAVPVFSSSRILRAPASCAAMAAKQPETPAPAISVALVWWLIERVKWATVMQHLTHADPTWLIVAFVVMLVTAPLVLKSTKGMLEMQKLQPEMRKLQNLYRGDRQKLNEEMMKLYQEHKVNPLASCFPLLLQMPVFIVMFQVLHGLTKTDGGTTFTPKYIGTGTELYQSLVGKTEMQSWGLDLAKRPYGVVGESFGQGLLYVGLVVALGVLYFVQQRMVASRAAVSGSMRASSACRAGQPTSAARASSSARMVASACGRFERPSRRPLK